MGQEIELKIPLTELKYKEIYNKVICGKPGSVCYDGITICEACSKEVVKYDEYFTRYDSIEERKNHNEPSVIRIRQEGGKSYFCIKRKNYVNGIEQNKEYETFVEDSEVLLQFFTEAGYHRWFYKEKSAFGAFCKLHCKDFPDCDFVFHLELVCVNGLKYAEIEVTSEDDVKESACAKNSENDAISENDAVYASKVSAALEIFVKKMGLNPMEKDPRSWYEIISELEK